MTASAGFDGTFRRSSLWARRCALSVADSQPLTRLYPIFEVKGARVVMVTTDPGGIDARGLGAIVGSLAERHHDIVNAVDLPLRGF